MKTIKVIQLINATVYEHIINDESQDQRWETSEPDDHGFRTFSVIDADDNVHVEIGFVVAVIRSAFDAGQKEVQ